ncbi:hypothetical protein A9Q99_10115 [Gammaproteobacteria bacterium 45_16_T64]|nr:hypothetical protein A9Q99_10115 [Gammaproteobacteria bacterium 45_16_T64]
MGDIGSEHHIRVETDSSEFGVDGELLLESITGHEAISELFSFDLKILCEDLNIDPTGIVGKRITYSITSPETEKTRYFNGYVKKFKAGNVIATTSGSLLDGQLRRYEVQVVPWFWFLSQNKKSRIFQEMTVVEIIEAVLGDHAGISDNDYALNCILSYETRNYCAQYQESDFDFISRLMEDEGIFYFFRHEEAGKHVMMLADHAGAYRFDPSSDGGDESSNVIPFVQGSGPGEQITQWSHQYNMRSGGVLLHDYDQGLASASASPIGSSTPTSVSEKYPLVADYELYEYPGKYRTSAERTALSRVRAEENECTYDKVTGQGDNRSLHPCGKFTLEGHDATGESENDYQDGYVITSISHYAVDTSYFTTSDSALGLQAATAINKIATAAMARDASNESLTDILRSLADAIAQPADEEETEAATARYDNTFEAMPATVVFRPRRRVPKPIVNGPQTAVVTGAGEIDPDEQGRVKVKFHWEDADRSGETWVRVSQNWAGKKWGAQYIPHVGQEVIVSFLQGDPDLPVITGRVYNNHQANPLALPADKTKSIMRDYGDNEFVMEGKADLQHISLWQSCENELWMEGKPGEEVISLKQKCENEISLDAVKPQIAIEQKCGNEIVLVDDGSPEIHMSQECGNLFSMEKDGGRITLSNPSDQNKIVMDQSAKSITIEAVQNQAKIVIGGDKGIDQSFKGDWHECTFTKKVSTNYGGQEDAFLGIKNSNMVGIDTSQHASFSESKNLVDRIRTVKGSLKYEATDLISHKVGDDCTVELDGAGLDIAVGSTTLKAIADGDVTIETKKKVTIKAKSSTRIESGEVVLKAKTIDLTSAKIKHKSFEVK